MKNTQTYLPGMEPRTRDIIKDKTEKAYNKGKEIAKEGGLLAKRNKEVIIGAVIGGAIVGIISNI